MIDELLAYSLLKEGAYLDYPFGNLYPVVKYNGRIFAELFVLNGQPCLTASADEETAVAFRLHYDGVIVRGYHCPRVQARYKSTAYLERIDEETAKQLIDLSYEYVKKKTKK